MSDDERLSNPLNAAKKLRPGDGLILRHRDSLERRRLAVELRSICQIRKIFLIIASDPRLAMAVGADGIHFAEKDVCRLAKPAHWARQRGMIVMAAAHSETAIRRAETAGVNGLLVSPVCNTFSHPGQLTLGVLRFARMVGCTTLPVYGLGGVDQRNLLRLRHTGMVGMAGISAIADSN